MFDALKYFIPSSPGSLTERREADVIVYGGTSSGVIAAVQLRRLGRRVILLEFGERLGGMSAGGLGATDFGSTPGNADVGGLSRQFYRDVGRHYDRDEALRFEPHVAEAVFDQYVREHDIPVFFRQHLASVKKSGPWIEEIAMRDGSRYAAKAFIDATYEGDLLALAGVSHHVGRESNETYGEVFNGVQPGQPYHAFTRFVDPYKIAGDPRSGLCWGITEGRLQPQGSGDDKIQAFNFRMCLTDRDDNRRPFPCPTHYDPERYVLMSRYLAAGVWDALRLTIRLPNGKTDTNNFGGFSTDNIGRNHRWPEASHEEREAIFQDHVNYQMGLMYFLATDKGVPGAVRDQMSRWGLPKDEFTDTGGWPHQLYIREGRRMISDYVMTERNVLGMEIAEDSIGMAAYGMDSHHCQRIVVQGRAFNEGDVQFWVVVPYPISYRSIRPREEECSNLLVSWCVSASHIAFGSIRMEPVGMVLGQSAAIAADMAIRDACPVQKVEIPELQKALRVAGQVLDLSGSPTYGPLTPIQRDS